MERGLQKCGRKPYTTEQKEVAHVVAKERLKLWKKAYFEYQPAKRLLWAAKKRAKERNLDFDIVEEDIVVPTHCPYLGIALVNSRPRGSSRRDVASLDRVDPTKGYIKGNVQVISQMANTMKSDASNMELISFAKYILEKFGSNG